MKKRRSKEAEKASLLWEDNQDIIVKVLADVGLNRAQIRQHVSLQPMTEEQLSVKVDLHGLSLEETKGILQGLVGTKKIAIGMLELVHGYKRGTVLKDYIEKDFRHIRLEAGLRRISNEGVSRLFLKPWHEVLKEETVPKFKRRTSTETSAPVHVKCEDDAANEALFQFTMIQEKVKGTCKGKLMTRESIEHSLTDEELAYVKPLLDVSLNRGEFLNRVLNLYVHRDIMHVVVSMHKMQLDEARMFIDKLLHIQNEQDIILMIKFKNRNDRLIRDYVQRNLVDDRISETSNVDEKLTVIRMHKG